MLLRALVWFGVKVRMGDHSETAKDEDTLNLLLTGLKAEVSEEELRKLRKAVKDGHIRAAEKGRLPGRPPAGFKVVQGKVQLNELGEKVRAHAALSIRKLARELGVPVGTAYDLRQSIQAFERGELGELMRQRSHAARAREARAEEQAQKKRAETIAWLVEIVPAKFGR